MSYAQVTTENSRINDRKRPQTTANDHKNDRKRPQMTANDHKNDRKRPQMTANDRKRHKNDRKRLQKRPQERLRYNSSYTPNSSSPFWVIIHFLPFGDFVSKPSFAILISRRPILRNFSSWLLFAGKTC